MTTRVELLNDFESRLNGFIIRCDAFKEPATGDFIHREVSGSVQSKDMSDKLSKVIEVEESPEGPNGVDRLERHIIFYYDDDDKKKKNVQFYRRRWADGSEEAYWLGGQDPIPSPPQPTFRDDLDIWLNDKIGITVKNHTIIDYNILRVNENRKRGLIEVIADNDVGETVTRQVMVIYDGTSWSAKFLK